MVENAKEEKPKDSFFVSQEENKKAYAVPATLINRFIVNWDAFGMRLTLGEQISETETNYRCAVVMAMPSAIALHQLLERMFKDAGISLEEDSSDESNIG